MNASDADNDPLQYFLTDAPDGLAIDRTTGLITWESGQVVGGDFSVTVEVIDGFGGRATQIWQLRVNTPPEFLSNARVAATPDVPYIYQTVVQDVDGDALQYSIVSGPAGLIIDDNGRITWTPTVDDLGTVAVEILAVDRFGATATQNFDLVVSADATLPTLDLFTSANRIDAGQAVTFEIDGADDVSIASITLSIDGIDVPLDATNSATFTFETPGVFRAVATATDSSGNVATETILVGVLDPNDNEAPVVSINSPAAGTEISYLTNIIGSVSDQNLVSYRLEYARADLVNLARLVDDDPDFNLIAEGNSNVDGQVLGVFDPTILQNDAYILRLIATDVNGQTSAAAIEVSVIGAAKLGTLELGFTDLVTSLDGIDVRVTRNYSSLEAGDQGDFGFGWNLSLFNANIRESVPDAPPRFLGAGESPLKLDSRVYITAPDGQRLAFTFAPEAAAVGLLGPTFIPRFDADPGNPWRLEVPESATNSNILQINDRGEAQLNFVGAVYNPETYILISPEGTRYTYEQHGGLTSVEDAGGNRITVSANGFTATDGRSIEFVRDAQNRITQIIDPDGNAINYQYDRDGNLSRVVDRDSLTTTFGYLNDPAHFLDTITNDQGTQVFKAEFDEDGRLTSTTDGLGNTFSQDFDPSSFTGTRTDPLGNVRLLTYDINGNVTAEEDPLGNVLQFEFADELNPTLSTREISRRGFITDSTYDENGNLLTLTEIGSLENPLDESLAKLFTYTDDNIVSSVTNENGDTTSFEYDAGGNLTRVTNALGDFSTFTYDEFGRQIATTDYNGNETLFTFTDEGDQPTRVTYADGTYQEFGYNAVGQITLERYVEPDGTVVRETRTTYDGSFRTTSIAGGENSLTSLFYDGDLLQHEVSRVEQISDTVTTLSVRYYQYDDNRRVTLQGTVGFDWDQTGDFNEQLLAAQLTPDSVTQFRYDALGNRILLQDPVGNITTFVYDANERVIEVRDALFNDGLTIDEALAARLVASGADLTTDTGAEHVRAIAYDGAGNQIETIDQNGRRTEFEFDHTGRVLFERQFSATAELVDTRSFTYDNIGNLLTATDSDSRYEFTYNEINQLVASTNAGTTGAPTVEFAYTYDAEGNVLSVTDNFGVTVESTYDSRNLLLTRQWFDANGNDVDDARVDFTYNAVGQILELTRRNQLDGDTQFISQTTRTYDLNGFSDTILHTDGAGDLIAGYDYDYNLAGSVTTESRQNRLDQFTRTIDYSRDTLGQLEGADFSTGTDEDYVYDANGNRTSSSLHSEYIVGAGNRIASDGTFNYTHDGVGNIVSKVRIVTDANGVAGEATTYEYDHRNRLTSSTLTAADGTTILLEVSYAYDAFDKRISRTENGVTVYFVYNGTHVWADFNSSGEPTVRYLKGDQTDDVLARFRTGGEGTAWYLADQAGSIRDLVDETGQQVNHTEYASFGQILSQLNESLADRYSFTGREFDASLGLYYYRARMYDPSIGTFTANDQLGFSAGDTNLSRYAFNSPLRFTDPSGNTVVVEYSVFLDNAFSDENLALAGVVSGFSTSTFSYLGYFLQTGSQSAALDRLTQDLSTLLVFDWAVSTIGLAGDVFNIPTEPLGKIGTYINGLDGPPEGELKSRLQSEASEQLSAFKAVEARFDKARELGEALGEGPKPFDPSGDVDDTGGFINGARLFISILRA